jgi:hypothetical protein
VVAVVAAVIFKEEPVESEAPKRDQWVNASILLNNCFAITNMERHEMTESQIERAKLNNDRFLNQIAPAVATRFGYNRFMAGLEEGVSEAEFREQMFECLHNFLDVVGIAY